jgi:hypothetical protein
MSMTQKHKEDGILNSKLVSAVRLMRGLQRQYNSNKLV